MIFNFPDPKKLAKKYRLAKPIPHISIDNLVKKKHLRILHFSSITRRPSNEKYHLIHHSKALFEIYLSRWVSGSIPRLKRLVFDEKIIKIHKICKNMQKRLRKDS